MANLPIFIINLPRDSARRAFMEEQLNNFGVEHEFIDGVYGDDPRISVAYDDERAKKEQGKTLTQGEKGCAFSHKLIYEKIIKEKMPYALILEDDVKLPADFFSRVNDVISKPHKWDWVSFDYAEIGWAYLKGWFRGSWQMTKMKPTFFFYALIKLPYILLITIFESIRDMLANAFPSFAGAKPFYRPLYKTGGYVISLEGAQKLLPFTEPLRLSADRMPNLARRKTNFKLYGYVPQVVFQDQSFESNTRI